TESIGQNQTTTVGGDSSLTVSQGLTVNVTKDANEKVDGEKTTTVAKKVTLAVGSALITVEQDGTVTVVGKDITVKGDGVINVESKAKVLIKAAGQVDVDAGGGVKLKGTNVSMN